MDGLSIYYADDRISPFYDESAIRTDILQKIDFTENRQRINCQINEFAAICTFSGLADTGILWVDSINQNKLVELKSLKYYSISSRNVWIFQEDVTSCKFNDLNPPMENEKLLIKKRYGTLGVIDTTSTINSNEQKS